MRREEGERKGKCEWERGEVTTRDKILFLKRGREGGREGGGLERMDKGASKK